MPSRRAGIRLRASRLGRLERAGGGDDAVGGDPARVDVVERHAVAGGLAREHLERGDEAGAVGVGELEDVDRLAHGHRADRDDAAEAALAHPRQQRAR